jgi:tRNA pseudouridine55 synthase
MPLNAPGAPLDGVLLVDKPRGLTSHDVVARLRRVAGTRRVGHAGTLDPMATGLLLVCIGPATRIVQFLTGLAKEYSGTIRLGAVSSTYDAEGTICEQGQPLPADEGEIQRAMNAQLGLHLQMAPPFSAVRSGGKRLYEYARRGEAVPERHRRVRIDRFTLTEYERPDVRFFARVGSGTYVRAMAHDLGAALGCGAYLSGLRRETVGGFSVEAALPLDLILDHPAVLDEGLLSVAEALGHLPKITVDMATEEAVLHGRGFSTRQILSCETLPRADEPSLVLNSKGEAMAVVSGEPVEANGAEDEAEGLLFFKPLRVLGRKL